MSGPALEGCPAAGLGGLEADVAWDACGAEEVGEEGSADCATTTVEHSARRRIQALINHEHFVPENVVSERVVIPSGARNPGFCRRRQIP